MTSLGLCVPLGLLSHQIQAAPGVPAAAADSKGAGAYLLTSLPMRRATKSFLEGGPGWYLSMSIFGKGV